MKTNSHSHFKALKFAMIKLCLFTFLFQVTDLKAQNHILLDHTWYFEIGNIDEEELTIPVMPLDLNINEPIFESILDISFQNTETFLFLISHNHCEEYPMMDVNFSSDGNTFMGTFTSEF
jgi:hypothetical protein